MELMVLDKNFDIIEPINVYKTLIWTRRYHDVGVYELHASTKYFDILNRGRYLYRNDRDELGLIQEVNFKQDDKGGRSAFCKGNFAEAILNERVLESTVSLSGTPEEIARTLVDDICISTDDEDRVIQHLVLGDENNIGSDTSLQATGAVLGEKLYTIEATQGISHKIRYNYLDNKMEFEVWEGKDRRDTQDVNSLAVFSNSFVNVKDVVYNRNDSDYKNYAYVFGEGEGSERVLVIVDSRTDESEERKELYVDARDLQKNTGEKTYTDDEYEELLRQRGIEKLANYKKVETVTSNVDPFMNLEYLKDFDLGDLCTYTNTEIGIALEERITEIQEVYEGSKSTLTVTFGTDEVTSITQLIKKEVN